MAANAVESSAKMFGEARSTITVLRGAGYPIFNILWNSRLSAFTFIRQLNRDVQQRAHSVVVHV